MSQNQLLGDTDVREAQRWWLQQDHMCLVLASGGVIVCIFPNPGVHGVCMYHSLTNLRLDQLDHRQA